MIIQKKDKSKNTQNENIILGTWLRTFIINFF